MIKAMSLATASLAVVCMTGCFANETPELRGLAHTKQEFKNMRRVSMNQNVRAANDEITRALLLDNPSRLSPWPVVDTSGMPR